MHMTIVLLKSIRIVPGYSALLNSSLLVSVWCTHKAIKERRNCTHTQFTPHRVLVGLENA